MLAETRRVFILYTIYYLLSTVLMGCAMAPVVSGPRLKRAVRIDGASYVSAESLSAAYNLDYQWDPVAKKALFARGDKEAKIMADSAVALLNSKVCTMNKEAVLYGEGLLIPESFARRTLAPFFKEEYIEGKRAIVGVSARIKAVIIDPGHGGKDPGAIGRGGLKEKDVALDIAKRFKRKLNAAGINVIMTRDRDRFVSLSQRSKIANANAEKADFFISVHANASRSKWVNGVEVFYLSEAIDDNLRSLNAVNNSDLNLKESYSGKYTPIILRDLIFTEDRRESIQLAELLSRSLSKDLRQRNRGEKPARFYVLKKTNIPALLVEVGFISNHWEEKRLRDSSYREKIAQGLLDGIVQYNRKFDQETTRRY